MLASVDIEGDDLGHRLVADGLAWHHTRYSKDAGLAAAEREARTAGRGLWADSAPVLPWEWRATKNDRVVQTGGRSRNIHNSRPHYVAGTLRLGGG